MPTETAYEKKLVTKLKNMFPGCKVMKTDPQRDQGIPDLLILFRNTWAMLEVKVSETAPLRPNQHHHVCAFNDMSYAAIIYPENEQEILRDLQLALGG